MSYIDLIYFEYISNAIKFIINLVSLQSPKHDIDFIIHFPGILFYIKGNTEFIISSLAQLPLENCEI